MEHEECAGHESTASEVGSDGDGFLGFSGFPTARVSLQGAAEDFMARHEEEGQHGDDLPAWTSDRRWKSRI